jgi:two-component system cell cycle sensor histidine kinase/response regulator CckA
MANRNNRKDKFKDLRISAEKLLAENLIRLPKPKAEDIQKMVHELNVYQIELEMQNETLLETQRQLEESIHKYTDLYDYAPVGYFTCDEKGLILEANLALASLIGKDRASFIGTSFYSSLIAEDRDILYLHLRKIFEAGGPQKCELRLSCKGKELHAQLESIVVEAAGHGSPVCRTSIIDITERKRAEEKIKKSEYFIRNILDTVDEGFIVVDRDYRIQIANRAYREQLPIVCDDIIGKNCFEVSHRTYKPCYEEGEECAVKKVFEDGKQHSVFHKQAGPDNTVIFVEAKAFPLKDISGSITAAIEVISNITEKHLLEEERLKTQKLEAVGTLAGGIAHDFNNLLQGVFGYISLAKMWKDDKEKATQALEQAEKALQMTVKLTNQLLTFSKGGKPVKKTIDILPVVENAAKFALSGSRTDYRITPDKDLWKIVADEGQISQVIQNIVLNADQAMLEAGRVEVRLRNVQAPAPGLPNDLAKGEYVDISIKDTGIGIPGKYLQKIFEPYFTTKDKGSGLGLATSYSIIKNHNGEIKVESEPGKGTTFRIYLPATIAKEAEKQPAPLTEVSRKKGRILVMDDEEFILNIAQELLRALGHEVDIARNGTEAISKYREAKKQGKPFDIAILDMTIRGGMGGSETLKKLLEFDPTTKAVVSSGYSNDEAIATYDRQGFKGVLQKPYNIHELQNVLNRLLNV